ncbi:MAG: hypothetical protein KDC44_25325 [Phaeodactylibacter sp.]|nr:hypothetical protein [Phaeodactylibacter sp.]
MKRHLFTLLILMAAMLGTVRAQQAGTIISVTPLFDYSVSQTQAAINNMIPINLPTWVVNLLTDIDYGTKGYKVIYYTKDFDGNLTLASGAMIIPQGYSCNHDMMVYCHGTVFDPDEVPSRMSGAGGGVEFIFGLLYAGNGYVTVMPDYLGLGDGPDLHLYVDEKTEASATVYLMKAVDSYTGQNGIGLTGDVMISGYSQGGHAGMSTFRYLEEVGLPGFDVATAGLGSGPYDLATKQYQFIVGNPNYPTREYILYTVASCQEAYGNLYNSPSDILVAPYDQLYTTHILGQTGQTDWVPTPWPQMFVPSVYQNYTTNPNNPLRQCLQQSNVYDWDNRSETEMYYCTGDEQVAYQNSTKAEAAMEDNLPWWLFWMIPFINSTYVGSFDHFDCVIPYGILSKWHFDRIP